MKFDDMLRDHDPHVERRFAMPFEHPAARVTDYIRCLRAIWDTYQHGTHPAYTAADRQRLLAAVRGAPDNPRMTV